jgi:LPS sulfotransferase NodH
MTRVELIKKLNELRVRPVLQARDWPLVCDAGFRALFTQWEIAPDRLVDVDDPAALAALAGRADFAVVCCERPEGPVQNRLKAAGVASVGLFSQLIHRLAAQVAPRFALNKATPAAIEYAILCLPRCGSTLLAQELQSAGAGHPTEHFKAFLQPLLRNRDISGFDPVRWWELVRLGNPRNGVFGTKIIFDIWTMVDRFLSDVERRTVTDWLKSRPVVYLEREDKLGQSVSDVIARRTGVWHLWNKDVKANHLQQRDALLEGYRANDDTLQTDLADAVRTHRKFIASESSLLEFLDDHDITPIHVRYSRLAADPKGVTREIAEQLGVSVPDDHATAAVALEPTGTAAHELLKEKLGQALRHGEPD